MASELEGAIGDEFGPDVEIETHIEPAAPVVMVGHDVDAATRETIETALHRSAAEGGKLRHVHEVRVRGVREGLLVNYHCEADGALSVEAAHEAVDAVERALREDFPQIIRIVGHCEPIGANETA